MLVSLILSLMVSDALSAYFLLAKRFYQSPKLRFALFENQIRSLNNFFVFPSICVDRVPPHGWSCRAILPKSAHLSSFTPSGRAVAQCQGFLLQILNKRTKATKADFNPNMQCCQVKTVADFGRFSFGTAGMQTALVAP